MRRIDKLKLNTVARLIQKKIRFTVLDTNIHALTLRRAKNDLLFFKNSSYLLTSKINSLNLIDCIRQSRGHIRIFRTFRDYFRKIVFIQRETVSFLAKIAFRKNELKKI